MLAFIQNVGGVQLLIILLIVFIVFGAGRLPQVFEAFGKAMKSFRDAQRDDAIDVDARTASRRQLDANGDELADADEVRTKAREKA